MATGVNLPKKYLLTKWKSLSVLLGPVLFLSWLIAAGCLYPFLGVSFLEALLIAACVTPTDPVLASSILEGKFADKHIPPHLRNIIAAESGANDGLGYPFVELPLALMLYPTTQVAIQHWIVETWLFKILLSIIIGAVVGYIARVMLLMAQRKGLMDKQSFLAYSVGLSILIMGGVALMGSDDLLACFVAGNVFTWDDYFRLQTQEAHFQETIDMLLNCTFFIFLGTAFPWHEFKEIGYASLFIGSILLIILKRLPLILATFKINSEIRTIKEAVFAGWFGPIGAGAIFYALDASDKLKTISLANPHIESILFPSVCFMVLISIFLHGITVPLFHIGAKQIRLSREHRRISRNLNDQQHRRRSTSMPVQTAFNLAKKSESSFLSCDDSNRLNPDNIESIPSNSRPATSTFRHVSSRRVTTIYPDLEPEDSATLYFWKSAVGSVRRLFDPFLSHSVNKSSNLELNSQNDELEEVVEIASNSNSQQLKVERKRSSSRKAKSDVD